jgi:ATP-dependent Clp protease ATP-binding subunit ClpA
MTTKVFVSYSHANRKWIEAGQFGLIPWLASALRRRQVEFWYDRSDLKRAPGADYRKRIERAILEADFALLLISTDYLVSDFIRRIEMPLIRKRLDRQELAVIPILVDHAQWQLADGFEWIMDRQMLPSEMTPLLRYTQNEVMWSDVRAEILEALMSRIQEVEKAAGPTPQPSAPAIPAVPPLFDSESNLNLSLFSLDILSLLLRATKRRNLHGRAQVSVQDLIAALVRKGDLLRVALRALRVDPDEIYKRLVAGKEDGQAAEPDAPSRRESTLRKEKGKLTRQDVRDLLRRLFARNREDFSPELCSLLETVLQRLSADAADDARIRISEWDLMQSLFETKDWQPLEDRGLPPARKCSRVVTRLIHEGEIDKNGSFVFRHIDKLAVNIIGNAHALAQNLGVGYISHRILLIALLSYEEAYGAKLLSQAGQDVQAVITLLKETLSGQSPRTFGLNLEVCAAVLLPTVQQARQLVSREQVVTDEALFKAFCSTAGAGFKEWLKSSRAGIDLDRLKERATGAGLS